VHSPIPAEQAFNDRIVQASDVDRNLSSLAETVPDRYPHLPESIAHGTQ
jgi:hypothetical protein